MDFECSQTCSSIMSWWECRKFPWNNLKGFFACHSYILFVTFEVRTKVVETCLKDNEKEAK